MKKILGILIVFLWANNSFCGQVPKLIFEYAIVLDWFCSDKEVHTLNDALIKRLKQIQPELNLTWEHKGSPLVHRTLQVLKKPYKRKELTVDLTLCEANSSMSYPYIVNTRHQIYIPNEHFHTRSHFIYTTYQLFLFRYLYETFPSLDDTSKILKKYKKEPEGVKNRLFPHAIERYVYGIEGRAEELQALIDTEIEVPESIRAWEIVNTEGAQRFLDELMQYSRLS